MLWLNTTTGDVLESPKRPSPAWVTVVSSTIGGKSVESTLEGLRRAMMNARQDLMYMHRSWHGRK